MSDRYVHALLTQPMEVKGIVADVERIQILLREHTHVCLLQFVSAEPRDDGAYDVTIELMPPDPATDRET